MNANARRRKRMRTWMKDVNRADREWLRELARRFPEYLLVTGPVLPDVGQYCQPEAKRDGRYSDDD